MRSMQTFKIPSPESPDLAPSYELPLCSLEKMELEDSAGGMETCLKFLKGSSDEQRLVGLLLATKYVQGDNKESILQIFNAMGIHFLNRLLKSGVSISGQKVKEQKEPFIQLAISVLSAFCRVPELAASDEIVDKISTLLEILKDKPKDPILADCLECLLGIGSASRKGSLMLQQWGAFPLIMDCLSISVAGSASLHVGGKLVYLLLGEKIRDQDLVEAAASIKTFMKILAELFSCEQGPLKHEILGLLQRFCTRHTSNQLPILRGASFDPVFFTYLRNGIGQILQGHTDIEQKFLALELAESLVGSFGSDWLLGPMNSPKESKALPLDMFFLLLVETLRVETIVFLNEVAWSRFDRDHAMNSTELLKKRHMLAMCYSLLEAAINITVEEEDEGRLSDMALQRTVSALNEVIITVIEFLCEAKKENMTKGDDILASARLFSRYLADAPFFQMGLAEKFLSMLEYLCKIKSDCEESPFFIMQFLLPVICEMTKMKDGCRAIVSSGAHKQVIAFMVKAIGETVDHSGPITTGGEALVFLLAEENRPLELYTQVDLVPLLSALPSWANSTNGCTEITLAAWVCVLILDLTNEEAILSWTSRDVLSSVYDLVIRAVFVEPIMECESAFSQNPKKACILGFL